jgi:hypothetical protein
MTKKIAMNARVAHAFRQIASALATGFGMLLLVADSNEECEGTKSFDDEFNFVSTCTPSAIAGSGGTSGVAGVAGIGAAMIAGTAGAAGSSQVISGHVSLSVPFLGGDYDHQLRAGQIAAAAFRKAGLNVLGADAVYSGACSGGEYTGKVHSVTLSFGSEYDPLFCSALRLPVHEERTVTCAQETDGSSAPKSCTVTFTP